MYNKKICKTNYKKQKNIYIKDEKKKTKNKKNKIYKKKTKNQDSCKCLPPHGKSRVTTK